MFSELKVSFKSVVKSIVVLVSFLAGSQVLAGSAGYLDGELTFGGNEIYMALTSHERGFKRQNNYPKYKEELNNLLLNRANLICQAKGFLGLAGAPETAEVSKYYEVEGKKTWAWIPRYSASAQAYELSWESFLREKPWDYRFFSREHALVAGFSSVLGPPLGLLMAGITVPIAFPIAAVGGVVLGTVMYHQESKVSPDEAEKRRRSGKKIKERSSIFSVFAKKVPHLRFSTLFCSNDLAEVQAFSGDIDSNSPSSSELSDLESRASSQHTSTQYESYFRPYSGEYNQ